LVAEVRVAEQNLRVTRLWLCVDVGCVVNPSGIDQQLRGGMVMGLSATVKSGLTVANGAIEQTNFDGFEILRMNEMPEISLDCVESAASPGGIGEAGVSIVAPAVANAVHAACGIRPLRLPIRSEDLQQGATT
jgi:isoquinoline 1-oxidoreductase beta subunit